MRLSRENNHIVKKFQSDGANEIIKKVKQLNIKHKTSLPHVTESRGVSERAVRTSLQIAVTLLQSSGFPKELWPEAVAHGVSVRNRLFNKTYDCVPLVKFTGEEQDVLEYCQYEFGEEIVYSKIKKSDEFGKAETRNGFGYFLGWNLDNRLQVGHSTLQGFMSLINLK